MSEQLRLFATRKRSRTSRATPRMVTLKPGTLVRLEAVRLLWTARENGLTIRRKGLELRLWNDTEHRPAADDRRLRATLRRLDGDLDGLMFFEDTAGHEMAIQ